VTALGLLKFIDTTTLNAQAIHVCMGDDRVAVHVMVYPEVSTSFDLCGSYFSARAEVQKIYAIISWVP
jgi:hypothetical protein